jgi:hypothetical protein
MFYRLCYIGKDQGADKTLCAAMNLTKPPSMFQTYNKIMNKTK